MDINQTTLNSILDAINDGFLFVSPDGMIQKVNPAMERLTGYTQAELTGQKCTIFQCDACMIYQHEQNSAWCRLFEKTEVLQLHCHIRHKNGSIRSMLKNAKVLKSAEGEVIGAVEILADLSLIEDKDRKIKELQTIVGRGKNYAGLVGNAASMHKLYAMLERASQSEATVVLLGESGTGKELAAHAIHSHSKRADKPYIQFNCAAFNENLLEAELFGHVRGAFTGALKHRTGYFEAAQSGTIFLDEIGELPLAMQVKLLRVLETKKIQRIGETVERELDVRIIVATNKNLAQMTSQGQFRSDLYYRINMLPIDLPKLTTRLEDLPLLTEHFLQLIKVRDQKEYIQGLTPECLNLFWQHNWPGNVRELKGVLEYACAVCQDSFINSSHLPPALLNTMVMPDHSLAGSQKTTVVAKATQDLSLPYLACKQDLIKALEQAQGNLSTAAKILGVHRGTIRNQMLKFGLTVHKNIQSY